MEEIQEIQSTASAEDWRQALERVVPCVVVLKYVLELDPAWSDFFHHVAVGCEVP